MSNVIKSSRYTSLDSKKLIEAVTLKPSSQADSKTGGAAVPHQASDLEQAVRDMQVQAEIDRILDEARAEAADIVRQAEEHAEKLREEAEEQIAVWRESKQQDIEEEIQRAIQAAHEQAYQEGLANGERDAQENCRQSIETAASVLQDAYAMKREVIAEAEPFLLELSVQIAETVIGRQLSLEPEWVIQLIQGVLSRERRKGLITLCVSPEQFPFIREAREELNMVLDSQAELQIVPDVSVQDYGCVVRSDFGSLDARIDSQLTEIKQALLQVFASEQEVEEA